MDKTNVVIKIPGMIDETTNFLHFDEEKLVEKTIGLLQSRKNVINVLFKSNGKPDSGKTDTLTKIEILLADEKGNFNYYED